MSTLSVQKEPDCVLPEPVAEATTVGDFCNGWLALQCDRIMGAEAGLVLLGPPDRGPFAAVAVWPHAQYPLHRLTVAAEQALRKRSGLLLQRQADGTSETSSSESVQVAYPIKVAGRLHGVVVVEVTPRPTPELQHVLRQLCLGTAWLEGLLHRQEVVESVRRHTHLQTILDLLATTVEPSGFYAAATAFVTDMATRLACERVSLGFVRRRRVHLQTISHSVQFNQKTNLTRAIENAMDEALDEGTVIVYPPVSKSAYLMTRAHEDLVRQHGAGAACSVPLTCDGRICGVLTLERPADKSFDTATVELCEAIAAVAGPVLEVKRRESRSLPAQIAASLRKQVTHLIGPSHVVLKLITIGLVALFIFFAVARSDYRVVATTLIEAHKQRVAVAPFDGYIADAPVSAGDVVQQGDLLCVLDDRDLKLERLKWQSQREQYVKQYHLAMAQQNAAQVKIIRAQIAQIEAQLALVEDQLARTQVRAPFDGAIVTGDLSQSIGAPVERGEVLFTVAPLDTYRIILQVDERDTAEVKAGQRGNLVLSAFPAEPLPFTVEKITPVSIAREGRNYFRVEAQLDHTPTYLRPGMEGVAKIDIDRRLLLWNWTHRAIDWLRLFVWAWWP